jgi:hypothetical protein
VRWCRAERQGGGAGGRMEREGGKEAGGILGEGSERTREQAVRRQS